MNALTILAVIGAVIGIPAVIDVVVRGDLRRMAVRNIVRRPFETGLIIIGSALGTAIITAALMVGDTFETSIRDIARTNLGEVDLIIEVDDIDDAELLASVIDADRDSRLDGVLPLRSVGVAVASGSQNDAIAESLDRPVEPQVSVSAVDFDTAASFGSAPGTWAFGNVTDPGPGGAVINDRLAADLELGVGDTFTVFAAGSELELAVTDVTETVGLGGFSDAWVSASLFEALGIPGSVTADFVALSITGTVFDSTGPIVDQTSDAILDTVLASASADELVAASPAETLLVDPVKQRLIDNAAEEDEELTTIFFVVGGFSVLAGALLLINLFVMLSEERKPSLGVLRAIGWKQSTLRRAFRTEGLLYAVPAAVTGAVLGVGVGWAIIQLTKGILQGSNPDSDFQLITTIGPDSLLTAGLSGFVIAMLAIWFTSWRISRLNIVSAIRDLPAPTTKRSTVAVSVAGAFAIVVGALATVTGLSAGNPYIAIVSVPLIVVGMASLLKTFVPTLWLTTIGGIVVLAWGLLIFELLPNDVVIEIQFFLVYGVVLVAAGVALATVSGTVFQRMAGRSASGGVAARLAMAYPTARLFRTSSSLAMYSLIIFSLTFMAVLAQGISAQSGDIVTASAAGHQILVNSNNANPIDIDDVVAFDGVSSASAVTRSWTEWSAPFNPDSLEEPRGSSLTAASPSFVEAGAPLLVERDGRFGSDQEAFDYVLNNRDGILISNGFLGNDDPFEPSIGDQVIAADTGLEFEVIGIYDDDFTFPGVWINGEALAEIAPEATPRRLYVALDGGVDATVLADQLEVAFLANGAQAETFEARVSRILEADLAFFSLLRGYLLLGLLIGIGGLAVTLSRAVRERRRQIGMLRSMGFASRGVGGWFLGEAAFISLMGIICGAGLGVLSAYFVATRSTAFDGGRLPFVIPWVVLAALVVVPLIASGIAAVVPARRAAALRPSEALRLAD